MAKTQVVIEIRGGCLSGVYARNPDDLELIVVDHDVDEIWEEAADTYSGLEEVVLARIESSTLKWI